MKNFKKIKINMDDPDGVIKLLNLVQKIKTKNQKLPIKIKGNKISRAVAGTNNIPGTP